MKKVLLSITISLISYTSFGQYSIFMKMLENKILCNEDRLVNLLEHNDYSRVNNTNFHYEYIHKGEMQHVNIAYDNNCYALYTTTDAAEYNLIKKKVNELCSKEVAQDNSIFYNCDANRMHHVQLFFLGYFPNAGYEIKIYQYPKWED